MEIDPIEDRLVDLILDYAERFAESVRDMTRAPALPRDSVRLALADARDSKR